jgi:uncharacterized membrane protein
MVLTWLASLVVFLALDTVWLGVVGGSLYTSILGDIMLKDFRIVPAVLFYALQITGILVFVLPLGRQNGGLAATAAYGAFYGICTYGTYDLTNDAVLRVWTTQLTVIDMVWGTIVTAVASVIGALVWRWRS